MSASPCPPPPQSAAAPMPPPRRCSSRARCRAMRAPDHAQGVADGDGAAVDVDLGGVEAEFAGGGDPDGGECFVDFDEVEVGGVDTFLRAGFGDGTGGLGLEGGVRSGDDAVGTDFRDPGQAEFFGLGFAHHHDGGGAVGDRGGGAGGDGAVLAERGTQFAEGFGGGVGADAFVLREDDSGRPCVGGWRRGRLRCRRGRLSRRGPRSGVRRRRRRPARRG